MTSEKDNFDLSMNMESKNSHDFSAKGILAYGLMLAITIEVATILLRYGFNWQTTRDTQWMSPFTFGWRVHHGYLGVAIIVLACGAAWLGRSGRGRRSPNLFRVLLDPRFLTLLLIVGIGLTCSDIAHHLMVLWPITGSPQFDLVYPVGE